MKKLCISHSDLDMVGCLVVIKYFNIQFDKIICCNYDEYENHYDISVVFMGDRDFLPLIKAVKDYTGKRVFGIVFDQHFSDEIAREFDKIKIITVNDVEDLLL